MSSEFKFLFFGLELRSRISLTINPGDSFYKSPKLFGRVSQIALARCQIVRKHIISHSAPRQLSGDNVEREMHSAIDTAAGDFIGQRRKAPVSPNHIWSSAEIYLESNVIASVKERELRCQR